MTVWPTEKEVRTFYGYPGKHQVRCELPFPMIVAWDPKMTIHSYSCHEKVKEPMEAIWRKTLEAYGENKINDLRLNRFGGCFGVRNKRGGNTLSMHSWGIAVDIDPELNGLKLDSKLARLARPEYDKFWQIVEGQGAVSLGRERNFDWMHFQFARL